MNPIVHAEASWLLSQGLRERRDRVLVTCAGLAPDLDGLSLLAGEEFYSRYHHVIFHGYVGALVTMAVCTALARQRALVALLSVAAFHGHLLCDLAGSGPDWPIHYLWPQSMEPWAWSGQWNLGSWQNSLIGLATTLACLACALPFRRTALELLSPRWDAEVVRTVRRRFSGQGDSRSA
jgi:inner membrane protein